MESDIEDGQDLSIRPIIHWSTLLLTIMWKEIRKIDHAFLKTLAHRTDARRVQGATHTLRELRHEFEGKKL
jgi:hypothetical protein